MSFKTIEWLNGGKLVLLDQRYLPTREQYITCEYCSDVAQAIADMVVRGAPAIGVAAAYGTVLSALEHADKANWKQAIRSDLEYLVSSRPTAVNLQWAVDQMSKQLETLSNAQVADAFLAQAQTIEKADRDACKLMADHAIKVFAAEDKQPFSVLTHCNTGALATAGSGTALGAIKAAWHEGLISHIYADETRPWLQGSRLTAWELCKSGIPVTLIVDGAAAMVLRDKDVAWVVVGADRIAANGDVANKVGTYSLAALCRHHKARLMVVAPTSTIDMALASGDAIEIEERNGRELLLAGDRVIAPEEVNVFNPVFDVTPAELVDVIVTDKGAVLSPDRSALQQLFKT